MNPDELKLKRPGLPTLVHVARLSGVGISTASRALNKTGYVSEATMAKVLEAADQLGYQRNEAARSLKVRSSSAIGIVIPDIGGPFMAQCVRAAQNVIRDHQYISVLAFTDGDSEIEAKEIRYLARRQVDGLLVVPAFRSTVHFHDRSLQGIPVVSFDQPLPGLKYDSVLVRNKAAAQAATEHLIGHGHTRIACLGIHKHLYSMQKRMEGYNEAIKAAGLHGMLQSVEPSKSAILAQMEEWLKLKKPPTAIFCLNEFISICALEVLGSLYIRIPEDLAFIGFDEIQLGGLLQPPVTVVVQPAAEIGEKAASLLINRLSGTTGAPVRCMLNTDLVIRRSCGCHR